MRRSCFGVMLLIYIVESTDYRKCHHIRKRKELRCHGNDLGAVPANIPADLVKLEIKNDDLSSGFEFPELTRLRKLWLTNVNIGKEFPKLAFAKLKLLQDLRITYLPSARKNYTVTIHPEAFHMMKRLSTVRLMNLGIQELPEYMFKDSKQLRHIYVNGMPIETIRSNTFAPLERVQQLNLMHNKISTIEEGTFDCMDATYRDSRIYLSNNRLRSIPEVDSISRTQIMIQDNPIVCDCNLVIPSNFNDRKAICEEPSSLKETYILDLKGKAIQCVCHHPDIVHGEADHDSSLQPGEYLKISCHTGYSLQVLPSVQCQEDGTFGNTDLPECIEDRVEPEELEDGSLLIISNAFSVYPNPIQLRCPTDTVVKSCKCAEFYCQGVVLEDTSCRVYAAPGNATKGELICIPTDLLLEHYTYEYTENFEHYAKCKPYYQMTACTNYNPMTRVATDHGVLDQDMSGICRVDCGNIDCDLYIRCLIIIEKKKCDKFSIYMGSVTKDGVEMTTSTKFEEGDVVTITCDEGYEFDLLDDVYLTADGTQATLTCIEGEIYDPPEIPMCFEIIPECELVRLENVVASPGWTVFEEDTITLTCGEGYEGEEVVVECQYGGVFQQPQIHCQERVPVQCPIRPIPHTVLTLPDGSELEERSVLEGTILLVSCGEGYELSNNNSNTNITCLATGKMSAEIPSCTEVIEPELETCVVPLIRHGGVDQHSPGDEIEPGTVITVYCSEGYSLKAHSSNTLECITKQYYQPNRLPKCKKREVRCQVPQLFNGYYHPYQPGQEILKDEILYPVCEPDYILEGPVFLVCTDERFGGEVNRCEKEKIDCDIPFIANGEVMNSGKLFKEGDSYPIVCDRGYYNTYTYINCVVGPSTYDPYSVPDCLRPEYGCPKVGFPLMKPLLQEPERGDSVEVECIEGYTLVGDSTLTCGTRNDYTARKLPDCVPIAGCETPIIENGSVNSTLAHIEDGLRIELSCNPGYAIYGDPVITCEKGSWSGIITPECRTEEEMDVDCRIPFVNNGIFWPLSDSGIVNPGSTLLLLCNDGFGVENDFDRVMCVTTAIYDPPLLPECVELEITGCLTPNIQHGRVNPSYDIGVKDTVYVTCDEDYELQGPEELECGADGSYDELPVCTEKPTMCPAPEIDNAIISPNHPIKEGTSYIVVCNSGYERVGDEELICGTDGVTFGITNGALPQCRKIPEPCEIPSIKNGWFVSLTLEETENVIAYEEEVIVICNQPDYGPDQTRVTCIGNSRWSPSIPRCTWEGPTCEFPIVANGVVSPQMDIVMPWTTLTIECDEGFEKNPKVDLECINSGEVAYFNDKIPVCEQVKIKCNRPVIKNGYINGPDPLETDDRFTVECNEGYELVGPGGPLVCYKDDIYSRNLPACQMKDLNVTECFRPFVQNAKIVGSSLTGYYVTVVCNEGYSIEGPSQLQCLSNGQFDKHVPQCVFKHAPNPDIEPISAKECGQRAPKFLHRIYGGTSAEPGEYPWNVIIHFTRGRFCGGSIVSKDWVLTAGHCLLSTNWKTCDNRVEPGCRLMNPRDIISISAGVNNVDVEEETWQVRTGTEVRTHPFFTSQATYIDYDVGLIKVNKPLKFNDAVNRVCLPNDGMGHLVGNTDLHVSGWGKTNSTPSSETLQKISVPYVSRDRCNSNISYNGVVTETMFCAGYKKGKIDACQGDSGGPLVYLGSNGTFVQGGIISWGRQCAMENFYGVYTNLAYFHSWIMSYIGEN